MRNKDVTKQVMQKIVQFEKKRTYQWIGGFILVMLFLCVVIAAGVFLTYEQTTRQQTWDVLAILQEDKEIMKEFWKDAVSTIFLELPYQYILLIFFVLLGCIGIIIGTRNKRKIMKHKIKSIKSYTERRPV